MGVGWVPGYAVHGAAVALQQPLACGGGGGWVAVVVVGGWVLTAVVVVVGRGRRVRQWTVQQKSGTYTQPPPCPLSLAVAPWWVVHGMAGMRSSSSAPPQSHKCLRKAAQGVGGDRCQVRVWAAKL